MLMSYVGVPSEALGFWVGLAISSFSICQVGTAVLWGHISDRIGRKPVILICGIMIMIGILLFGFSTRLWMILTSRALMGLSSGDAGVLKTSLAEMVKDKELQTIAFSILPLGLNLGWAVGPILGGLAANPYHVEPGKPHGARFLERYPYALPNLIAAVFFLLSWFVVFFGYMETLESKKGRVDYGIMLRKRFVAAASKSWNKLRRKDEEDNDKEDDELESAPLLSDNSTLAPSLVNAIEVIPQAPQYPAIATWKQVLDRRTIMCIISYSFLTMHSSSYDTIISVFMAHPKQDLISLQAHLPFKFNGGFGSDTAEIGLMFTIFGCFCMFIPILLVNVLNKHFSVLHVFRYSCSLGVLPIYIATPFTALLPHPANFIVLSILFAAKGCMADFGFISGSILIARTCKFDNGRGRINGLQTMASALARIVGPLWAGSMLDLGARAGYIGVGFWGGPALVVVLALLPLSLMTDD
ncbi:hypothetical protein SBOR_0252 [Sclerotinia borealis F-4128]|uniref:Major facilitator superfamily (MFS) profile domain-containing protein n=1 Tax=Sclerotinia borealis (strain F-4128) TaxID=1432307 RepID=W9CRG6_SCLBF|nr:hypothetical protein SBOR_0252 [Sclerotinia borealis F-4128]